MKRAYSALGSTLLRNFAAAAAAMRFMVVCLCAMALLIGTLSAGKATTAPATGATLHKSFVLQHSPAPRHPCPKGTTPSPGGACATTAFAVGLAPNIDDPVLPRMADARLLLVSEAAGAQWRNRPPDRPPRV